MGYLLGVSDTGGFVVRADGEDGVQGYLERFRGVDGVSDKIVQGAKI